MMNDHNIITSPVASLRKLIGNDHYENLKNLFYKFRIRPYQVLATKKIFHLLSKGKNCLLLLDPGLGKTLISQLVFLSINPKLNKHNKFLVLVPSRLLRDQHYKASYWFRKSTSVLNIDSNSSKNPIRLRNDFEKSTWIISTPKRLTNAIKKDYELRQLLKNVSFCVVDEFDAQSAEDIDDEGEPIGRFSEASEELVNEIKINGTIFLCMSATNRSAAEPWLELFDLNNISIPKEYTEKYQAFILTKSIKVIDESAIKIDNLINLVVTDALRKIRYEITDEFLVNPEINPDKLHRQAKEVIKRNRDTIYFEAPLNLYFKVTDNHKIMSMLGRLLKAYAERLFLYEGRLSAIELDIYERWATINDSLEKAKVQAVSRIDYEIIPTVTNKILFMISLIKKRENEKCLIMVRNTDVNHFIYSMLKSNGINSECLWGEMNDTQRRKAIDKFHSNFNNVLITNREMGGRGFDLPIADYCIFISPKRSHETMWQEMLRIRSTFTNPKDAYIMFYGKTKEEDKYNSLIRDIMCNSEDFKTSINESVH